MFGLICEVPPSEPSRSRATAADASRRNSQLSTGPKTDEGKLRVRGNAISHGLAGLSCMLPGDNVEAYDKLGALLIKKWKPVTEEEFQMVSVLHDTQWRLARIPALELDMQLRGFEQHIEAFDHYEEPTRSSLARAAAYEAKAKFFEQIGRHESRLYRIKLRTEAELRQAISDRQSESASQEQARAQAELAALLDRVSELNQPPAQPKSPPPAEQPGFELQANFQEHETASPNPGEDPDTPAPEDCQPIEHC